MGLCGFSFLPKLKNPGVKLIDITYKVSRLNRSRSSPIIPNYQNYIIKLTFISDFIFYTRPSTPSN